MIKVENVDYWGVESAIRGMRNPKNSWDKSDSFKTHGAIILGAADLHLMRTLYKAGTEHRKYLRQIFVSMDITAPLYWWKEFDTYKVGIVSNSCSTMHKILDKYFSVDDFSYDHLNTASLAHLLDTVELLNSLRDEYYATDDENKKRKLWYSIIQTLPTSYNQRRTITMNYENVVTIIKQRASHKLDEWRDFVKDLYKLPYISDITKEE